LDTVLKRKLLAFCDKLIFVSKALKNLYLKLNVVSEEKSEAVYNLPPLFDYKTDTSRLTKIKTKYKLDNKKVILFVGRKTRGKGVDVLLESAKQVFEKDNSAVFVFVGKEKIRKRKKYLRDISSVSHEDLFHFYKLSDIVVVPTIGFEPLARVPLEAFVLKKPVIVSNSGGLKEQIVDGKSGLVVLKNDAQQLTKAVLKLFKNKQLRIKMGEEHKKHIAEIINKEKIIKKQLDIYKSLQ
jgi:glycosyltransferase involved in cell wall biosynthesis